MNHRVYCLSFSYSIIQASLMIQVVNYRWWTCVGLGYLE